MGGEGSGHEVDEHPGDVGVTVGGTWDFDTPPAVDHVTVHAALPGADDKSDPASYTFGGHDDAGGGHSSAHAPHPGHDPIMDQIHEQIDGQDHFHATGPLALDPAVVERVREEHRSEQ